MLTDLPRADVAELIDAGEVTLGGAVVTKPSRRVRQGDIVELDVPERRRPEPPAADAGMRRAYGERSRAIVSGYTIESAADGIVAACTATEERRPAWKREASTARG